MVATAATSLMSVGVASRFGILVVVKFTASAAVVGVARLVAAAKMFVRLAARVAAVARYKLGMPLAVAV